MSFDSSRPWRLHPQVALRPEPFGALAYHYGNRRLTFLRSPELVSLVEGLGEQPSVDVALDGLGLSAQRRRRFVAALAGLAGSEVICAPH